MHIVASVDIGEFGSTDGEPVTYYFHPLYHVQGVIPWLLLGLAFVAVKENRTPKATWILVPVALVGMVYSTVMKILQVSSGSASQLNVMFSIMVLGFSMIWLLAERIGNRNRLVTFLLAILIYFGFLGVNLLSNGFGENIIAISYLAAISILAILLTFIIAVLMSPKPFSTYQFFIYIGVALFILLLFIFSTTMFLFYPASDRPIQSRFVESLIPSFFGSLIYYAGLLPFLILLLSNSFWRKRFEALLGIQTRIPIEPYS